MVSHSRRAIRTVNPGDRITKTPQTLAEKSRQLAVDAPDITGDHITVPTYFMVRYPDGEEKALHHVRDARLISDIARQYQFESGSVNTDSASEDGIVNLTIPILVVLLCALTLPFLIGIF